MEYCESDFLYNLDVTYYSKVFFSDEGIEMYLLYPKAKQGNPKLAISRGYAYRGLGINLTNYEYDVFSIDHDIPLEIRYGEIILENEEELRQNFSAFAKSFSSLLMSFGANCFSEFRRVKEEIEHIIQDDNNMPIIDLPVEEQEKNSEFSLFLQYESPYFTLRSSKGHKLLEFKRYENAQKVLHLLIKHLSILIRIIRRFY